MPGNGTACGPVILTFAPPTMAAASPAMENQLVNAQTGALVEAVPIRDLDALMKVGAELVLLSTGQPTSIVGTQDSTQVERCLRESDAHTRKVVLRGLRAALEWTERTKQGGG